MQDYLDLGDYDPDVYYAELKHRHGKAGAALILLAEKRPAYTGRVETLLYRTDAFQMNDDYVSCYIEETLEMAVADPDINEIYELLGITQWDVENDETFNSLAGYTDWKNDD